MRLEPAHNVTAENNCDMVADSVILSFCQLPLCFPVALGPGKLCQQCLSTLNGQSHTPACFAAQADNVGNCNNAGSKRGSEILADWSSAVGKFWQLVPPSEESTPEASPDAESLSSVEVPAAVSMAA